MRSILFLIPVFSVTWAIPAAAQEAAGCSGTRTIVLTREQPQAQFAGTLRGPGPDAQDYEISCIDVSAFDPADRKRLRFDIALGRGGTADASFDLFPAHHAIPRTGRPDGTLGGIYDLSRGHGARLEHDFTADRVFQFGATGNWGSPRGTRSPYEVTVSITPFSRPVPAPPPPVAIEPISPPPAALVPCPPERTVRLSPSQRQARFGGTLVGPGRERQAFQITCIDLTAFTGRRPKSVRFLIDVGGGESAASFDIFPGDARIPVIGGPDGTIGGLYDMAPGSSGTLEYRFDTGKVLQFGATGNWFSREGATNDYSVTVLFDPL